LDEDQVLNDVDVFKEEIDLLIDQGFKPFNDKVDSEIYKQIFPSDPLNETWVYCHIFTTKKWNKDIW